jgi:hypothetical protein
MRSARLPTLALVALAMLALAGPTAADARARDSSGCMRTREGQRLLVGLSFQYTFVRSIFTMQQGSQKVFEDRNYPYAALRIGGTTCEVRRGRWRALDPVRVGLASVGLGPTGQPRGKGRVKGWGAGISFAAPGVVPRVDLQVMYCSKGTFFRNLKFLANVPLPWTKYIFSVVQWGVGLLLPGNDKVKCQDVGVMKLRMLATSTGELRVVAVNQPFGVEEVNTSPAGSQTPGWTFTQRWNVLRPKQTVLPEPGRRRMRLIRRPA